MLSEYVINPAGFNRRILSRPPCWRMAAAGPLVCALLHSCALKFYSDGLSTWLFQAYPQAQLSSIISGLYFAAGWSPALTYLAIWLVGTGSLVCVDVLADGSGPYSRALELTGLAFYSQVPYLLALAAGSLWFELPPGDPAPGKAHPAEIVAALREALEGSLAYQLARHFGYAFRVWLVLLFVLAYRTLSGRKSTVLQVVVGLFLLFLIALEPWSVR